MNTHSHSHILVVPAVLSFSLGFLLTAISASAATLSDIAGKNQTAIQYLSDKGVIAGYSDGTFKPQATVNRAELAKILVTANGATPTVGDYNNCFSDVTTEWFAPYVCYAKEQGWVSGYSDGTFRPSNPVNTAEAIKMILNAQGIDTSSSASSTASYSDVDSSAWYASYVNTASAKGLLQTTSGKLGVSGNMTRGLVAESIYRSLSIKETGASAFVAPTETADGTHSADAGFAAEDLQQYLDAANAAADKTILSKTEFTTALAALMKADRPGDAGQSQSSRPAPSSFPGGGSMQFPGGQPPNIGSGSMMHGPGGNGGGGSQEQLASASSYLKYTDTDGNTVLLALDADGNVIMKWPMAHRGGGSPPPTQE
ncbi:MAG: S-layer homology domain-containing protein [Candidatus Peribacteraceae bacterium]